MSNQIAVPYTIAPQQEQTLLFELISDGAWRFGIYVTCFYSLSFRGPTISVRLPHCQACVLYDSHDIEASIIV